jgi:hypothetical protein
MGKKNSRATVADFADELAILINVRVLVQKVLSGNANVLEPKLAIVDTVELELHTHFFHPDSVADRVVLVSNPHEEHVDALVLSIDVELGKDNGPSSMDGRVGNPILLAEDSVAVDDELLGLVVIVSSGLHLDRLKRFKFFWNVSGEI